MYYTKKEALEKLGIPESTFYFMVNDGRIRSYLPPHRKRGALYDKEQIDAIAAIQVATGQRLPTDEHLVFSPSSEVDLAQEVAIGLDLYGADDIVPLSRLRLWWQRNPEMFLSLKRSDGVLVGYSTVTPLKHETIMKVLRDEIREIDIDPEDISPFVIGKPLECYIASLTVVPGPKQREYATALIHNVARFIRQLGERGVDIIAFYAVGVSEDGRRITTQLGFEEIYRSPDGERIGYVLRTDNPNSRLVRYYQAGKQRRGQQQENEAFSASTAQAEHRTSKRPRAAVSAKQDMRD